MRRRHPHRLLEVLILHVDLDAAERTGGARLDRDDMLVARERALNASVTPRVPPSFIVRL